MPTELPSYSGVRYLLAEPEGDIKYIRGVRIDTDMPITVSYVVEHHDLKSNGQFETWQEEKRTTINLLDLVQTMIDDAINGIDIHIST